MLTTALIVAAVAGLVVAPCIVGIYIRRALYPSAPVAASSTAR